MIRVSKKERFIKGFWSSLGIHLLLFLLLAFWGLFALKDHGDKPFEVVFVGGGGGNGGQTAVTQHRDQQIEEVKQEIKPDDITEQRKPQETKPVQKQPEKKPEKPADQQSKDNNQQQGQGSQTQGQGTGKGAGEGNGTGGGEGSGTGQGKGDGRGAGVPVTMPRLLNYREPEFPFTAIRDGLESTSVVVRVLVTSDGRAQNPVILRSSGRRDFDNSALQSAKSWRFSPAKDNQGRKIDCYVNQPVNFKIRK